MCGIVGQINERGFSASFEEDALASLRHRARMRKVPGNLTASGGGAATATQQVDVTAILDGLAAKNREKLDWRHSIVDLMKLVGMDSSLNARKQLAAELHYSGDQNDSASTNIWLHKEIIQKIAENGGKVPQDLLK